VNPENLLYFILLCIAVMVGWLVGRIKAGKSVPPGDDNQLPELSRDYFIGLNYLLQDEPDEAIDVFINALEVNSETVDTHLALGTLLRRRGKVDRAITVHQSLLARPRLSQSILVSIQLELARDYIAAGLLDRAERLLKEILEGKTDSRWEALNQLITIYQMEKEWNNAIDAALMLLRNPKYKKQSAIKCATSHFHCELAQQAIREERYPEARDLLKKAVSHDKMNIRAVLLGSEIEIKTGHYKKALKELAKIKTRNPLFLSELSKPAAICFQQLGKEADLEGYLRNLLKDRSATSIVLAITRLLKTRAGDEAAAQYLAQHLKSHPSLRGLSEFVTLQAKQSTESMQDNLAIFEDIIQKIIDTKPGYHCNYCGFEVKSLHWLCPSCNHWGEIQPVIGMEGE